MASSSPPNPPSIPTYTYWGGVRSRSHYLGYVLAVNNLVDKVNWNQSDIPYPGTTEWNSFSPKSYMGQLPQLSHNGMSMGQSAAIIRYLARIFKLYDGVSDADYAMSEQMIEESTDFHNLLGKAHYAPNRTAAMDAVFAAGGTVERHLKALEGIVGNNGSVYFCSKPLPGDCCVCAALNMLETLEPGVLKGYPKLLQMYTTITSLATVKAWNESHAWPYFKRKSDA
eukprot:g1976.t1